MNDHCQSAHDELDAEQVEHRNRLVTMHQPNLKKLVRREIAKERTRGSLVTTDVLHSVVLKTQNCVLRVQNFLGYFRLAVRSYLVSRSRYRQAKMRNATGKRITLEQAALLKGCSDSQAIELNDALDALKASDPKMAKLVRMLLNGDSIADIASKLGVSDATAYAWRKQAFDRLKTMLD